MEIYPWRILNLLPKKKHKLFNKVYSLFLMIEMVTKLLGKISIRMLGHRKETHPKQENREEKTIKLITNAKSSKTLAITTSPLQTLQKRSSRPKDASARFEIYRKNYNLKTYQDTFLKTIYL